MSFEKLIDSKIRDAIAQGVFSNLEGEGQPLRFDDTELLAGDNWLGYKILRDNKLLPEWLLLAKEIEGVASALDGREQDLRSYVDRTAAAGSWQHNAAVIAQLVERFREDAVALRRKQDQLNVKAPSMAVERPGIWIERRLERIRQYVLSAGCPPALIS